MIRKSIEAIFTNSFAPYLFLILSLLSYGLFLPMTGLYLDDWYLIWFKHTFGASEYINYFSSDRPFMGYFFIFANFILGNTEKPIIWQIFGIFTHWISVIALWQMLNTLWPNAKRQNTWCAMLSAVYPGFTQHWGAVIYCFFILCLAGFFFSITLMIKAIKSSKRCWFYYASSVLIMLYVVPASEFFTGLELARILILWFVFQRYTGTFAQRIRNTLRYWSPYGIIYTAFIGWRVFFYQSKNHSLKLDSIFSGSIPQIISTNFLRVYQAVIDSTLNAWTNPFNIRNYPESGLIHNIILILVIAVFCLLVFWQKKTFSRIEYSHPSQLIEWRKQAPVLSLFSLIVAIIPFISADLTIGYLFPNDRFLLAYLLGSCLLLVWIIEAIGHNELKTILLISILVSTAVGYQISNANHYKNLWTIQKQFFWQTYWRMPALKENTTLISYQLPDNEYWSGNALTAQLNWTYSPSIQNRKLDYLFIVLNSGQEEIVPLLRNNQPIEYAFRTYSFSGNINQSIFIHYTTDGCLRVFDSKVTPPSHVLDLFTVPYMNLEDPFIQNTLKGAKLSNLDLILDEDTIKGIPPTHILGNEPVHDWCYYFEKAELARQKKDYQTVLTLLREVNQKDLYSNVGSEYYPFIDALARTGNWNDALNLTLKWSPKANRALKLGLCSLWKKLASDFPNTEVPKQAILKLNCVEIDNQ